MYHTKQKIEIMYLPSFPFYSIIYHNNTLRKTTRLNWWLKSSQFILPSGILPVVSGICVAWSLDFCALFSRSFVCPFSFSHCVVCPSICVPRGRDRMVVGFETTYAISAYHHYYVVSSNPAQTRCTQFNIMRKSLSVTCGRSVGFSGYSGFLHQ